MKRYKSYLAVLIAVFSSIPAWGEIANRGEWTKTTISNEQTINLTGNVTIKGIITIGEGGKLTINANGAARTIKCVTNLKQMFLIQGGGQLIIKGTSSNRITIDGGAVFSGGIPFTSSGDEYTAVGNTGIVLEEAIQNNNSKLTLQYVTIQNVAGEGNGGAILVTGSNKGDTRRTSISNCTIQYCTAKHGSALHVNLENGGNAEPDKCRVNITNTTVQYCYSSGSSKGSEGGTIRTNGGCVSNINLKQVTIKNNYTDGRGGAVYWNGGGSATTCISFNGCTIEDNVAYGDGGGMMLETTFTFTPSVEEGETVGVTTVQRNKVINNTGGGIVITSYGGNALNVETDKTYNFDYDLTDKLQVINNTAPEGAGISFNFGTYQLNDEWNKGGSDYSVTANINFNGATISNNNATKGVGGGIRLYNNTAGNNGNRKVYIYVNLNKGTLSNNTAKTYGGGLYTYKADVKHTSSSGTLTITGNKATNNDGGGIYVDGGTSISLATTSIQNNEAKKGGAMAISSGSNNLSIELGTSTITGNHVTGNGGAIYLPKGKLTIASPTISGNYAANGGAVFLAGGSLTTTGTASIENNYATTDGGAFYVSGGEVSMASPTISNNGKNGGVPMTENGGAIYISGTGAGLTTTGNVQIEGNESITKGGAVYVSGGNVTLSQSTITSNTSNDGGAFYVTGGSITTAGGTVSNNTATNEGGVFYVNNGNINLGAIQITGNSAVHGGAISLHNGAFNINPNCVVASNRATGNGGGLYVSNTGKTETTITCQGGSFNNNSAANGGGIYASGNPNNEGGKITLAFAANVEGNTANNGGGIYMSDYVNMTFDDGLIRSNKAVQPIGDKTTYTTANKKKAGSVAGVGGGIFMADNSTLVFTSTEMGIYGNSATNAGADICSNGNVTTIGLPNITKMNLKGFDVIGNELYWVEDYFTGEGGTLSGNEGIRYEEALKGEQVEINEYTVPFDSDGPKSITGYLCLDLGYDLVFVTITTVDLIGDEIIMMSYPPKEGDGNLDLEHPELYRTVSVDDDTRKVVVVGLPSGRWQFGTKGWNYKCKVKSYDPSHDSDNYITIKNGVCKAVTITFEEKTENGVQYIKENFHRKVNRMKAKTN